MVDALLVGARFLQFAGASALLGSSLFYIYGLESDARSSPALKRWQFPRRILATSALAAAVGTIAWVMASTALFSGEPRDAFDPSAVWFVLTQTRFGRACLLRAGLSLIALAACSVISRLGTLCVVLVVLGALINGTFAWTGHGAMDSGWRGAIHVAGDVLHVWSAGIWVGALVPLVTLILKGLQAKTPNDARNARVGLDRFSSIGPIVVALLAASGVLNSWFLIDGSNWLVLFTTAYGIVLSIKLALFASMLALAAANRFRLVPRLRHDVEGEHDQSTAVTLRALKASVSAEAAFAVLVLLAVGLLGTLAPPVSGD
jgi:copper resistance protein D